MKILLAVTVLLTLAGCAERRTFWKKVEAGQAYAVTYDFGAGKKP